MTTIQQRQVCYGDTIEIFSVRCVWNGNREIDGGGPDLAEPEIPDTSRFHP